MSWWRLLSHPAVLRAGGPWAVLKRAWLVWHLLRDVRVPTGTKLVVPATLLYLISPINLIPNLIPLVGPLDDIGVLLLGMWLFLKLCPRHVVDEHEAALGGSGLSGTPQPGRPIDADYRRVA